MYNNKLRSFTLSEMLVVMVITVIVVGIAFSVLRLVQNQINAISRNFETTTRLSLLEEQLWQDFNNHSEIILINNNVQCISDTDTIVYKFTRNFVCREIDTIPLKLQIKTALYLGRNKSSGQIDALTISADTELPDYSIFISSRHDALHFMNKDGI